MYIIPTNKDNIHIQENIVVFQYIHVYNTYLLIRIIIVN